MRIDLTDMLYRAGETRELETVLERKAFKTKLGTFPINASSPVTIRISCVEEQILEIDASCDVTILAPCDRCLDEVQIPLHLKRHLRADLNLPDDELAEELDEGGCITEKQLDPDVLMHHEILSEWPHKILCKEECKGLCPKCGANRNRTVCACDTFIPDPRMAAIQDLFSKYKEV